MPAPNVVEELTRRVDGPVLRPSTPQYDEARRTFNALVDRQPAAIVQPRSAAGVSAAVQLAAEAGLPIAVRGGGHSVRVTPWPTTRWRSTSA